jgi:signal transduction histidine kinase
MRSRYLIQLLPCILLCIVMRTSSAQEAALSDHHLTLTTRHADSAKAYLLIEIACRIGNEQPDSALKLLDQALILCHRTGYSWGIAKSLQVQGIILSHTGRFKQGIDKLMQLIYHCLATGAHQDLLLLGYNILGNIYQTQGKYKEAAFYYHQALKLPRELVPPPTAGLIYFNLSRLTNKLKQPRKAIYYLDQAEAISVKHNLYDLLCNITSDRGKIYAEMGTVDSAIYYLHKCRDMIREYGPEYKGMQDIEYVNLVYLADLWLQQGSIDSAGTCLKRLHEIKIPVVPLYWNKAYLTSGKFHLQSRNYKLAEHYLLKVLDSAQAIQANNELANTHMMLTHLYNKTGNCSKALHHLFEYVRLKDSLENTQIANTVHQLEVKYRTSQKDRELISQKLKISQQQNDVREKNIWIAAITTGLFLLAIISLSYYRKKQADHNLQAKEIEILHQQKQTMLQQQEIEQLKAMMKGEERERSRLARELHDGIGGMITAIKMNMGRVIRKEGPAIRSEALTEIMQMLEDTSSEVRKTAHNLMPDVLVRHALPDALTIFCDHIDEELPTELSCEGDFSLLDKATELMIYRTVQELIQNIIKHASATRAAIQLYIFEGRLSLTVEDNGTGFDASEQHHGFGLENLRYRIAALHGDLAITSDKNNSTIVHIEFDLDKLKQVHS